MLIPDPLGRRRAVGVKQLVAVAIVFMATFLWIREARRCAESKKSWWKVILWWTLAMVSGVWFLHSVHWWIFALW